MSSSSDVDSAANASPLPTTTSASKGNGEGSIGANARRRRRNGFACTPHPGQVAAWLVLVLFSLWFFGVVVTATFHSPSPVSTAAYCAGGLLLGLHLFFHIFTTAVNPADERLLQQWDALGEPVTFDRRQHSHVIEQLYCNICQVHVDAQSKHCRVCNKCVAGIDHHWYGDGRH